MRRAVGDVAAAAAQFRMRLLAERLQEQRAGLRPPRAGSPQAARQLTTPSDASSPAPSPPMPSASTSR
jgi:hypothetical protein